VGRRRPVVSGVRFHVRVTVIDVARALPEIPDLRDHCRSLAMLEAILSSARDDRVHCFDAHWSEGEETASMCDGSGDEYSIVFSAAGAYVRGFAHESPMSPYAGNGPWPGVLDDVPAVFRPCVEEPAFSDEEGMPLVTACLWRGAGEAAWRTGSIGFPVAAEGDPDGAGRLFRLLVDRSPEAFRDFAEDYYQTPVSLAAVRHGYRLEPLTDAVVGALSPGTAVDRLAVDIAAIGYPARAGGLTPATRRPAAVDSRRAERGAAPGPGHVGKTVRWMVAVVPEEW
jgi:hypothetical protein